MIDDRNDTFADRVTAFLDGSSLAQDDMRRMREQNDQDDQLAQH
jgi:hypothetical protein